MASASIPGLTRGALGSVAVPAGCWLGMALGATGEEHGRMEGAPGRAEGEGGLPWSAFLTLGISWLLCPAQNEVPPASIQPMLGWVNWALEGGEVLFPRTLRSCWGKDEIWRGERRAGEEEGGKRQTGDLRAAKPALCPGGPGTSLLVSQPFLVVRLPGFHGI